jgi:hypothetical protein
MDEAWIVWLHEAGVVATAAEDEWKPEDCDAILDGPDDGLCDRNARARHYENLAENLGKSNLPLLPSGLCNACNILTLSDLRSPDGAVHSAHVLAFVGLCGILPWLRDAARFVEES